MLLSRSPKRNGMPSCKVHLHLLFTVSASGASWLPDVLLINQPPSGIAHFTWVLLSHPACWWEWLRKPVDTSADQILFKKRKKIFWESYKLYYHWKLIPCFFHFVKETKDDNWILDVGVKRTRWGPVFPSLVPSLGAVLPLVLFHFPKPFSELSLSLFIIQL